MKITKFAIPVVLLALVATTAKSQTFKSDFATQVVLAGAGTDPIHTLTLMSDARTDTSILMFPNPAVLTNYVLSSDGLGHLTWSNLSGNGIVSINGTAPIVASTTAGVATISITQGALTSSGSITVGGTGATVGSNITADLDMAHSNTWTVLQTFNGGLTEAGNANINTSSTPSVGVNSTTDIDATTGTGGEIYIGNNGTASDLPNPYDSSTTNIAGTVNFTGQVNIPASDLNLGLANHNLFIGDTGGAAAAVAPVNSSVLVTDANGYVYWGQTLPSGLTIPTPTITGNTNINNPATGPAANTNIDATAGTEGVVTIGNNGSGGSPGDSSTTYLAGYVDFTGTVQLPNGSVTAGSIGLAYQNMLVGNNANPNVAVALPPQANSVLITDALGTVGNPQWAKTLPSGLTYPAAQINGAGSITGTTTINTTGTIKGDGLTSDVSTNSGSALTLDNAGGAGGYDVTGTGNSWYVTDAGAATFNGGLTELGNANLNNSPANTIANSTTNIDAGTGTEGVINIGNNGGTTPLDSSTTNIAGTVNFTGQVNIPAGDLNLGLTNDEFYIGNSGGIATPQTISQDVTITNGGVATVNGSSATTFAVTNAETVGTTLGVTGLTTATGGISTPSTGGINNSSTINTVVASTTNIDATTGAEGVINIGNNGGTTPLDSSTTNIAGTVNFTGQVNIPAGDLNLGLTNDEFYIGNSGGIATPQTISQDVTITNGGVATVNGSSATTFAVTNAETVGTTLGVTGLTTATGGISTPSTGGINNSSTINTVVASTTNIDATTGAEGVINIGNNGGTTPLDSSTTNLAGSVNFTGSVTLPAGSVTASSLSLTTSHLFVGNASNDAEDVGMTGDAGIVFTAGTPDVGKVTVSAASGATGFTVTNATQLNGTLTAVGQTSLGSTAISAATTVVAADPLVLSVKYSYFPLSSASAVTVNTITDANVANAGQIIVLVNTNTPPTTASNYITLHSNGALMLNGNDVIIGAGGTATLISDGTNWHLMSVE